MSDLPSPVDANPVFHYLGAMENVTVALPEDVAPRVRFRAAEDGRSGLGGVLDDDG